MPDVFLDPRVADRFTEIDVRTDAASVVPRFLASDTLVLRGLDLGGLDFDFLKSISFPQTWEMKKFGFSMFAKAYREQPRRGRETVQHHATVFEACGRDAGRVEHLVDQFELLTRTLDRFVSRAFAGARIDQLDLIARFSETRQENLHFDIDKDSDTHEAFRLYVNIDAAPRIWAMSHTLNELARIAAGRVDAERFASRPAEDFVKQLTSRCFGGWHNRADERAAPRHMVYFDPGDVWVVDGRSISHQVLYGHRVITTYVRLPREGNEALKPNTSDKVRLAIEEAKGPRRPEGDWIRSDRVLYPVDDLKTGWADVFGQTGTGRVRRFDERGLVTASAPQAAE